MRRMFVYVVTVAAIIAVGAVCMIFAYDEDSRNIEFLSEYGWEIEGECIEREEIEIPIVFDDIYNDYNNLQKLAGLDISDYKGRKAVRCAYIVTNFPNTDKNKEIRANVLTVGSEPVAGDIMTVALDGFMYSLNYLKIGK